MTYEVTIRNHKSHAVDIRAVGHLQGNLTWEIIDTNAEFTKHDFQTIYFDFRLERDSERVIRYTAQFKRPEEVPESIESLEVQPRPRR